MSSLTYELELRNDTLFLKLHPNNDGDKNWAICQGLGKEIRGISTIGALGAFELNRHIQISKHSSASWADIITCIEHHLITQHNAERKVNPAA